MQTAEAAAVPESAPEIVSKDAIEQLVAVIDAVVDCANRAVVEALLAGYRLGLAGGVPAARIQRCGECAGVYLGDHPGTCLTCDAERSA